MPILVGAIVDAGPDQVLNQGIVWDPDTGAGDRYTKWHPVPFGEYIPLPRVLREPVFGRLAWSPATCSSGTRAEPLDIGGIAVADAICFDIAYDDGLYAQLRNGAQLLVVQTSNATFIHTDQIDQQFAITRLRAIETGRWVVVAATNGVSGIIAPDGHVVATRRRRTRAVLRQRVGPDRRADPGGAARAVDRTACVALAVLGVVLALLPYRRRRSGTVASRGRRARAAAGHPPTPTGGRTP